MSEQTEQIQEGCLKVTGAKIQLFLSSLHEGFWRQEICQLCMFPADLVFPPSHNQVFYVMYCFYMLNHVALMHKKEGETAVTGLTTG